MGLLSRVLGRGASPAEAQKLLEQGAVLLDVRERSEWKAGRAESARHVPLDTLPGRMAELPNDRPVVVVCRSGGRSAQATAFLRRNGIEAVNLSGGMRAWAAAGYPVVRDGRVRGHVA